MAASKSKKTVKIEVPPEEVAALVARVVEEIQREGIVLLSKLAALGVDKNAKALVLDALATSKDVEVTKRAVRVPVRAQLRQRLDAGAALAMKTIGSAAVGATKKEIADAIDELVAAREAQTIVRGTELAVASSATPVLDQAALDRLERALADLTKSIKLARTKKAALLEVDVTSALAPIAKTGETKNGRNTSAAATAVPHAPHVPHAPVRMALDEVLVSVERHREETSGMTFVPTLVRALGELHDRDAVHAALLQAADAGMLELRPESGMGRLSAEDQMLCLPGPQGSRLSWVRRVGVSS